MAARTLDPTGVPATEQIRVRLTDAAKRRIEAGAAAAGLRVADYVRRRALEAVDRELGPERRPEAAE